MAELYLIYLFIVELETVFFSKSGLMVSRTRAANAPANVNTLVCLNNWSGL